ncbi:hypothetical protein [Mycolicibacterium iranicum]|uniref:Uncharacterized protein n=1 Tax=Mycolicibacterium iranicum TaxID=912594 RepID=A0ABT4HPS4_MYCIR|nr:hypothetical protein [Mycolicibacterium iranicum]MCZ0732217.1 hypothetical protein [Mycolicibacterium iranicum]
MRRQLFHPAVHTTKEWRRPVTVTLGPLQFDMTPDEAQSLAARLVAAIDEVKGRPHDE